jgi:hypothetical protein
VNFFCATWNGIVYKGVVDDLFDDWSDFEMRLHEKRESAQIIQFPLNRRFEARQQDVAATAMDARVAAALDPAWYHMEAMDERTPTNPPKH